MRHQFCYPKVSYPQIFLDHILIHEVGVISFYYRYKWGYRKSGDDINIVVVIMVLLVSLLTKMGLHRLDSTNVSLDAPLKTSNTHHSHSFVFFSPRVTYASMMNIIRLQGGMAHMLMSFFISTAIATATVAWIKRSRRLIIARAMVRCQW